MPHTSILSVTLPYCRYLVLSYCRIIVLSYYRTIVLSYCRTIVLPGWGECADNNIGYELLQGIQRLLERNQAIPRPDPASVESKETTASPQSAQESDHCHAVPNPAAAALAYIEAMPQAFPAVFQQRAAIFMRHAALVSAIQGLLEDEDSHPHPPSADAWAHEHDASAEGKVQAPFPSPRPKDPVGDVPATTTAETAAAETATAAAATPTAEHGLLADQTDVPSQVACLQSEVARLLHLYEPGNVSGDSKLPMDATEAATSGPKPKPKPKSKTPMITEAALEDIRQRAVAARKQLEDATAEKDALLTKLKSEWGEMMYNMMVSAMETAAASPTAQPKPSGTLEASLYDAFVAVPQAAAAVERCEAELLEAERVFNQPYSVACRLEQHCERLWQLASPLAAALNIMTPKPAPDQNDSREGANLNGANLNGGGGGGGGGGDVSPKAPKPTKKTGPKPSLRSVLQDLLRLTPTSTVISSSSISINSLLPHQNGADDLSQHMSEQLARLQRDVDRKQQAVREAEKAYTELQAKVSDLLDEDPELIENFNATAATPAGASDARPLVRELHKALQDLQNSRRLCNEATERLRDRMQYLGSIGWVLERVGARIKFLLDLYPATLRALAQRVR